MKSLRNRRVRNVAVLILLVVLFALAARVSTAALRDTARLSGWCLFALILLLAAYNLRKKLPFLPLGSSAAWLQLHIYAGLLTSLIFGTHVGWRITDGVFESVLAGLYVSVFLSGCLGLIVSRSFARRLTTRGDEVMFERIAVRRKLLQGEVEELVLQCATETGSAAVGEFYVARLQPFFSRARNLWHHLLQSNRPRHALLSEMRGFDRYLNDAERQTIQEIALRVEAKDELDYQYALQATLKYWLFVHVPLTYALLVLAVFHLLLVHTFSGGIS